MQSSPPGSWGCPLRTTSRSAARDLCSATNRAVWGRSPTTAGYSYVRSAALASLPRCNRTAAAPAACLTSSLPLRAEAIGSRPPAVSDVILRKASQTTGRGDQAAWALSASPQATHEPSRVTSTGAQSAASRRASHGARPRATGKDDNAAGSPRCASARCARSLPGPAWSFKQLAHPAAHADRLAPTRARSPPARPRPHERAAHEVHVASRGVRQGLSAGDSRLAATLNPRLGRTGLGQATAALVLSLIPQRARTCAPPRERSGRPRGCYR
jgi:hypothetical protein